MVPRYLESEIQVPDYSITSKWSLERQLPGNSDQRVVFRFLWNHVCLFWFFCWAHFLPIIQNPNNFGGKFHSQEKLFIQKIFSLGSTAVFIPLNSSIFRIVVWTYKKRNGKNAQTYKKRKNVNRGEVSDWGMCLFGSWKPDNDFLRQETISASHTGSKYNLPSWEMLGE